MERESPHRLPRTAIMANPAHRRYASRSKPRSGPRPEHPVAFASLADAPAYWIETIG